MTTIAIFHENFAQNGGAERVAESMARLLPRADVLSTIVVKKRLSTYLTKRGIITTWMQALPNLDRFYRHYLMFYPVAVQSSSTRAYGLVLSSCFGFAKGLRRGKSAVHVCYCHTPPRWLWRTEDYMARERSSLLIRLGIKTFNSVAHSWDMRAARQPDIYIANSAVVAERLFCFYGRESVVLHPPIETERFHISDSPEEYFLVVSRLVGYKRIDLAIRACNRLGRTLQIIGDGPDRRRLEAMAGPTVSFLGRRSDQDVADHLARCRALIFAGEEDFGLTPLEANASGRPVVAFGSGGALETVRDGETGVLFEQPTEESLVAAILRLEDLSWNSAKLRLHAEAFSTLVFHTRLKELLVFILQAHGRADVVAEIEGYRA